MDLVFIGVIGGFSWLTWVFVKLCDRLEQDRP